jgi:N-acylneuraminate cytidylyltransferase
MNLCVIPARGGSKRIPRKNIKSFCGKPIIGYSIEAAIQSECFDRIIVSTDDEYIAEVARSFGAEVPFVRPGLLSNDYAGTLPVIKHAIEWYEGRGVLFDFVCCLYATAPFVTGKKLREAMDKLISNKADYCFTVTSFPYPIQRALKVIDNDRMELFYPEEFCSRTQDLEDAYHDAGQFYLGKPNSFKVINPFELNVITPHLLPRYLVQDIDTEEDWLRAELMYQVLIKNGELQ